MHVAKLFSCLDLQDNLSLQSPKNSLQKLQTLIFDLLQVILNDLKYSSHLKITQSNHVGELKM